MRHTKRPLRRRQIEAAWCHAGWGRKPSKMIYGDSFRMIDPRVVGRHRRRWVARQAEAAKAAT